MTVFPSTNLLMGLQTLNFALQFCIFLEATLKGKTVLDNRTNSPNVTVENAALVIHF